MSNDEITKVMIPFRRASHVKETDITGTGLGLPLVDAYIKLFQGNLEIQGELGTGTRATLHFPKERILKD